MSDDAHPRLSAPPRPSRGRLVAVLAACAAVALLGTSIVNRSRWTLECEDGQLVAYRGLSLPIGRARLDPDAYPAIQVPHAACQDVIATSREELEEHYVAATMHRIDTAIRSDDASELESAARVVDRLVGAQDTSGDDVLAERKRELVVALLRADLRAATSTLGRARARLRAAAEAGVPEDVLRTLQAEIDTLCTSGATLPEPEPPKSTKKPASPNEQEASRAL